jgi:putative membrane protein
VTLSETLAALNAVFNSTAAILMVSGVLAIKAGYIERHRKLMLSAVGASVLFLISYLTRYSISGDTHFTGEGALRTFYFFILISHIILAIVVVPLVLRTLYLGLKRRFDKHPRIARITMPIWLYVSVTGVMVYVMLYHFPGR